MLTLDKGAIKYDGSLVHGKMDGQGTLTFKNGDKYEGDFKMESLMARGNSPLRAVGSTKVSLVKAKRSGQGTLTTEQKVVYKGKFKQGIYQNAH